MSRRVSFPEMIRRKRDGERLTAQDLRAFVGAVRDRSIQESQTGAMLMAMWLKGMVAEETSILTREMMFSGEILDWPEEWTDLVVDKHSTGGVGDKVSLPLAPALAACGCKVPMISGRGLAHTGGTLDKMESIPGFSVHQSPQQVKRILQDVGCCIVGQTESLVPADKVLYALRDATSTVDSVPLITGSIISKKGAESLSALVLDVKFGKAALYKDTESARVLAHSLVETGSSLGICTGAVLSRMDSPIGRCVGHSLEVMEALEFLKGRGPRDLQELVVCLGEEVQGLRSRVLPLEERRSQLYAHTVAARSPSGVSPTGACLLKMCGKVDTLVQGKQEIAGALESGAALRRFEAMLQAQGVSPEVAGALCSAHADYFRLLGLADCRAELRVEEDGTVLEFNGMVLAEVLHKLGAGRTKAGDPINHLVGAELLVSLGQQVKKGDPWVRIHCDAATFTMEHRTSLQGALVIGAPDDFQETPLVFEFIPPELSD
ncbi:thymidine phosphorylase-like [Scleropages formosus]|uniref:Thymidine phosphorylase n=1 Tax=Scleropages formosus TaxID=113540 RepID=A0A0P7UIS2_SCLFO|nr:thymidine phosphorylase-like [Scleropages formosus]